MTKASCTFCQIVAGDASADVIFQNDRVTAFYDQSPQAPTHVLVIPNAHIPSLDQVDDAEEDLVGELLVVAKNLARRLSLDEDGYRVVINTGPQGGQSVMHLHVHLLGGRRMGWPPG
jgi:histidine triad (HIT) family protein